MASRTPRAKSSPSVPRSTRSSRDSARSRPTLLIVGEHDEPCRKVHEFMARTIPGARHVVLAGLGHLTPLEAPARFNRLVSRFLADIARPGAAFTAPSP